MQAKARKALADEKSMKISGFEKFGAILKLSEVQIRKTVTNLTEALNDTLPNTLKSSFLPQMMQKQISELIRRQMLKL